MPTGRAHVGRRGAVALPRGAAAATPHVPRVPPGARRPVRVQHALLPRSGAIFIPLTELNLQIYLIDVSQSVEHDHPNALEFLRKDCRNVIDFFARLGAVALSLRHHFQLVSDPNLTNEGGDESQHWTSFYEEKLDEARHVTDAALVRLDDDVFA